MSTPAVAAVSLRRFRNIAKTSLTPTLLVSVTLIGLILWLVLDQLYQRALEQAIQEEWQQRLQFDVRAQHARFDSSLKSFADTAGYAANYQPLQQQLARWNRESKPRGSARPASRWRPHWLPLVRSVDGHIGIDAAVVLDDERAVAALYTSDRHALPSAITSPEPSLVKTAMQGVRIQLIDNSPWLLAASAVSDQAGGGQGSIMIAAQIGPDFLDDMRDAATPHIATALLLGEARTVVAVSSSDLGNALAANVRDDAGRFQLIADELLLANADGPVLRHALWADRQHIETIGMRLLLSAREQRTVEILVFAVLLILIMARVSARIEKIHHKVENYARRLGVPLPGVHKGDQIDRLRKRLERMSEEVIAETYALEYQAQHDTLTNLPNRSLLFDRLESAILEAQAGGDSVSLFVMDLDQFKEINDTLGHHVGDRLLQEVGRRLMSVLRRTDTVSRLGGDEFALLLPGADYQRSKSICRKIIAAMERPVKIENFRLRASISIGVALCPDHGADANLLLQHADVAMYEAKRNQSGFAFYMAERDEHSLSRLGLAGELSEAITQNQLMLEYQPMVDIRTGRIFCAEALVRWCHPEFGCVPPDEFIASAEQTGVIRPLTLWVIDHALAQSVTWSRNGVDLKISVNLSVRSLQDRKLPDQVQTLVDKHGVDPANVILEITESAIMSDPLTARRVMRRLSNMGFQLSIDDFGTGYSSLAYLKQLPVDEIKIDKSFVTRMDEDENDAVIVRATIDLAHNLGLKVVAEGVESTDVWDLLEMLGCDTAQGYFIRKPAAPLEFARWIQSREWKHARWVTPLGMAR
ncbi:MAG: EAL domain-containing protein [Thiogranum sp.]|nr:EAL domain-containing protein [Thiogranum sp.]